MGGWGLYPWGRRTLLELESGSDNGSIVLPRWDLTDEKGFQDMTIKIIRLGHFLCALWDDRGGPKPSLHRWLTVHQRPQLCINKTFSHLFPPFININIDRQTAFCERRHLCTSALPSFI